MRKGESIYKRKDGRYEGRHIKMYKDIKQYILQYMRKHIVRYVKRKNT